MKINKDVAISLPIRSFNKEEALLIKTMLENKLYIYWNGKDLRIKFFVDSELNNSNEKIPVSAKVIRDLLDLKYLYNIKIDNPKTMVKNIIAVNPFIENLYFKKVNENGFKLFDKEIKIANKYIFDVPYYYQTKGKSDIITKKVTARDVSIELYKNLLSNTLIIPYIFEVDSNYFIFKNGDIIQLDSKFINNKLNKREETLKRWEKEDSKPIEEKENLNLDVVDELLSETTNEVEPINSIINYSIKKLDNNYELNYDNKKLKVSMVKSPDIKFLRNTYKVLLSAEKITKDDYNKYLEFAKDYNYLINSNNKIYRQFSFIYRKQQDKEDINLEKLLNITNEYIKNENKIVELKIVIDNLMKMYDSLVKENRDYSIKKINLNYSKPISKLNIPKDATTGEHIAKMLDFMRKNTVSTVSDEDLFNYLSKKLSHYKFKSFNYYDKADKLGDSFIKIFNSKYKGDIDNVSFIIGNIEGKTKKGLSNNILFVIENNNQIGTWNTSSLYSIPKGYVGIDPDVLENDFSIVGLYNINSLTYTDAIINELTSVNFFTDGELEIVKRFIGNYNYYGAKKVAKRMDMTLKSVRDDGSKEVLNKLKDTLDIYFINELSKEQSEKFKETSSGYARSFEDKKNINNYILKAMENNKFLKENFKYVEIDNDVDLEQFNKIESDYEYLINNKILPKLPEKIDLRFRKLGKMKAGSGMGVAGVYFYEVKTITIDISNEYSFIHEYGHALDYLSAYNKETISLESDFEPIITKYRENLRTANNDMDYKDVAYYSEATEIFARGFELYIKNKFGNKARLLKNNYEGFSEYDAFKGIEDELFSYFNELFE